MPIPAAQVLAAENRPGTTVLIAPDGTPYSAASFGTSTGPVPYTNRSGAIAVGGTAQQLAPANAARKGFFIQNVSAGDLWFNSEGAAVLGQPAIKLIAGAYYESPVGLPPGGAISIIGATTGQAFTAREY